MMKGLRIHSTTKVEMSSRGAIGSVYSTTVWKDMSQGAFGTELAVTLQLVSTARHATCCMRLVYSGGQLAYFGEIFAWGIHRRNIGRVREWASLARLTLAGSEEFARHVRSVCEGLMREAVNTRRRDCYFLYWEDSVGRQTQAHSL